MHGRRTLHEGGLHVDHRGQGLVVDDDRLEGVRSGVLVGGHDDGDAVTDVADLVDREGGERRHLDVIGDRPDAGDRTVEVAELLGAVGGHDVRLLQGGGDVDIGDLGVGHRAAQDRHVQGSGQLDVVGPVGLAMQQARVFLTAQRPAHGSGLGVEGLGHLAPPMIFAASWTDFTMLW